MGQFYIFDFENLRVWQLGRSLKKEIYRISAEFPAHERFGLTQQIRRSVGSITANIAEGSGRSSQKDYARFVFMARASALETLDHWITAYDLDYIDKTQYHQLRKRIAEMIHRLGAFVKYLQAQ
jgi:four helix bundle protein